MLFFYFYIGSCFGSFLTLLGERFALNQSICWPASRCSHCQKPLAIHDLLPIISFLFLKGRCRYCQGKLPDRLLVMELTCGALCLLAQFFNLWQVTFLPFILLITGSLALSISDLTAMIVEPRIFYFFNFLTLISILIFPTSLSLKIVACLFTFCFLALLRSLMPHSLGAGDLKLLTAWALFLGWEAILLIICLASGFALLDLFLCKSKQQRGLRIPFVPYLTLALILYCFFETL